MFDSAIVLVIAAISGDNPFFTVQVVIKHGAVGEEFFHEGQFGRLAAAVLRIADSSETFSAKPNSPRICEVSGT